MSTRLGVGCIIVYSFARRKATPPQVHTLQLPLFILASVSGHLSHSLPPSLDPPYPANTHFLSDYVIITQSLPGIHAPSRRALRTLYRYMPLHHILSLNCFLLRTQHFCLLALSLDSCLTVPFYLSSSPLFSLTCSLHPHTLFSILSPHPPPDVPC